MMTIISWLFINNKSPWMHQKKFLKGFTLIEILVVVFIISIVALAATLNFGNMGRGRDINNEMDRLQKILRLTSQTAIIEQTDLGIAFWRTGYAVWEYNAANQQWQPLKNDSILKSHTLPDDLKFNLRINNLSQILPENEKTLRAPQLWFSTVGSVTEAVIAINSGELQHELLLSPNGQTKKI